MAKMKVELKNALTRAAIAEAYLREIVDLWTEARSRLGEDGIVDAPLNLKIAEAKGYVQLFGIQQRTLTATMRVNPAPEVDAE